MTIANNASIAYAVITAVTGMRPVASTGADGGFSKFAIGVLTKSRNDGGDDVARQIAEAIGMTVVTIDTSVIEYHPGAINQVTYHKMEPAIALGKPVLFILENVENASGGILPVMASAALRRIESAPCAMLAISPYNHERSTAEQLAEGAGWDVERIMMTRTDEENRRIAEQILQTMPD